MIISIALALLNAVSVPSNISQYQSCAVVNHQISYSYNIVDDDNDAFLVTFDYTLTNKLYYNEGNDYTCYLTALSCNAHLYNGNSEVESFSNSIDLEDYVSLSSDSSFNLVFNSSDSKYGSLYNNLNDELVHAMNIGFEYLVYPLTTPIPIEIQFNYYPYFAFDVPNFINSSIYTDNTYQYGYDNGYSAGYNDGYSVGYGDGSSSGYQIGYNDGYEQGAAQDETAVVIFSGICSVALLPVNMFLGFMNFEVFGINIGGLVSAFLTIAIVVIIIRIITGKKW